MFNKKDRKNEGAFIDQTKRNIANSTYKLIANNSLKISNKVKNLFDSSYKQINEIIEKNKNNREFNEFHISFDKEKFFEDLKSLIDKKFLQRKTNTFFKITLQDINENLTFFHLYTISKTIL